MSDERPPRLRLIRVFLSMLAGFMAGLAGWTVVVIAVSFRQGSAMSGQLPMLPPVLQAVVFLVPAIIVGYWLFDVLGASR